MRPLVLPAAVAGLLFACSSAYGSVGSNVIGSGVDSNAPGRAQDYRVSADASARVDRLSVYLDKTNTAAKVELGLFAGMDSTHAGSRLGRCVISAGAAGAWNRCSITAVGATSGNTYWLAVLQPSGTKGTISFRNRSAGQTYGSSAVDSSGNPNLSQLPSPWSNGANWGSQTASVYADLSGPALPPLCSRPRLRRRSPLRRLRTTRRTT